MSSAPPTVPRSSQDFWNAAASRIAVTEKHPFLTDMVKGTLDEANFKYYVIQDALYLHDFADCLRRLAKTAPTTEDAEMLEGFAVGAEHAELDLHRSFFQGWNITPEDHTDQMPNTLLYTSYMKRVVVTESHANGLAVLLPCFWVYAHVGTAMLNLRKELGDNVSRPDQYDKWIDMYGGEEFGAVVAKYIAMVDRACETGDEETLLSMQRHFDKSCLLEHMFWDQASTMMKWPDIEKEEGV